MIFFLLIGYACIFWFLCYKRPILALASSFAFCPVLISVTDGGLNLSLSDLNILLCLPLLLLGRRDLRRTIGLGPLTAPIWAYLIVCLLSSAIASHWDSAIQTWFQMVLYFIITTFVFANFCKFKDLTLIPYYAVCVGTLWAIVGLGTNFNSLAGAKNAFGASLSTVLLIIFCLYGAWSSKPAHLRIKAEGKYLAIAGVIVFTGLVFSLSRGAWLGTICGLTIISIYTRTYRLLFKLVLGVIPVGAVAWFMLPPQLQFYALNFSSSAWNIQQRYKSVTLAQSYFNQDPLWGAGMGLRKTYDATNIIYSTLAETGIIGLLAFASIFIVFYKWTWDLRKEITPEDPRFVFISMAVGLLTSRLMHGMVDHYWSRGVITMVWASIGMVLCLQRTLNAAPVQTAMRQMQQGMPQRRGAPMNSRRPRQRRAPVRRATLRRGP